ncbi:MAG: nicotinamide-nucleotide amidase [Gammaproteobacteria bacterium]|nr:nicotinamide-nucleotide amidase [Gammaproteobacteria bacterium]
MSTDISNKVLTQLANETGQALLAKEWMLATAESCTGGWVAKTLTDVVGSSAWFERGFVTYTNIAKQEMLGVNATVIDKHGAVSELTVREMARGALKNSHAHISLAITGIAGPGGGSEAKPVGLVWFAWAIRDDDNIRCENHIFEGDREAIRRQAVVTALEGVKACLAE